VRAEDRLEGKTIGVETCSVRLSVSSVCGSYDILDKALEHVDNPRSIKAVERLKEIYELLKIYGVERYVSFDLAMVSKYHYYTGVIFSAYTYQAGSAIAKGGRYDSLLEKFGKTAPATGFVVIIDDLVTALTRQNRCPALENKNLLLVYDCDVAAAIKEAKNYREKGYSTVLMKLEKDRQCYTAFAEEHHFSQVIFL